jgi:hypothetical protein
MSGDPGRMPQAGAEFGVRQVSWRACQDGPSDRAGQALLTAHRGEDN